MTIFAGVFSLDGEREVPAAVAEDLRRVISRTPGDRPELHVLKGCTLAVLSLGILPGRGVMSDAGGACTLISGDPLLTPRSMGTRDDDLRSLHAAWLENDDSPLQRARGSFCAVQVDPIAGRLRMATDKLGARPLYVSFAGGLVYFSTALRILEGLSTLPLDRDLRGLIETAAFGFALGTRTRYVGVELMDGGEYIEASRHAGIRRQHYWRWSDVVPGKRESRDLSSELHRTFQEAVHWRLGTERNVLAFLSGGLDSRVVAASLLAEGSQVHSINLAPDRTLDLHLGRELAARLGTRHFEFPHGPADVLDRTVAGHSAWLASTPPSDRPPSPAAAWTGTGGSVGMGNVYLNDRMVSLLRTGCRLEAVAEFLKFNRIGLPLRALRKRLRPMATAYLIEGVLDQVQQLETFDEGRRLHLFLMMNDQRRHLGAVYESMDRIRIEYINPFFDSEFLRTILSAPIDPFMRHRLYNTWLRQFPFAIDGVAWQAYPGHEPCPLPMPEGLRDQWADGWHSRESERELTARVLEQAAQALANPHFPVDLINKPAVQLAWWLTRSGLRDYSHLLKLADVFNAPRGRPSS